MRYKYRIEPITNHNNIRMYDIKLIISLTVVKKIMTAWELTSTTYFI